MGEANPTLSPDLAASELLPVSEDLIPVRELKLAKDVPINFDGLLEPPLLVREDPKEGCGGHIWPAGMQLSKFMLRMHGTDLKGKTMWVYPSLVGFIAASSNARALFACINLPESSVELGAGGGLVGLAVAKGCELDAPLYITDQAPMIPLIEENIRLNKLSDSPARAALLDWGDSAILRSFPRPDIILAADCVYFEPAFPLLLETLLDLIGDETVCYFCFKKRRKADFRFLKQAKKRFNMTLIEVGIDLEFCRTESIFLYEMRKRQTKRPHVNGTL